MLNEIKKLEKTIEEQYSMTKDTDLLICELQHDLEHYKQENATLLGQYKKENAILWDIVTEICEDSNPSYLYDMRIKAEEKVKEIHNA